MQEYNFRGQESFTMRMLQSQWSERLFGKALPQAEAPAESEAHRSWCSMTGKNVLNEGADDTC
jgi:hypothetical protein